MYTVLDNRLHDSLYVLYEPFLFHSQNSLIELSDDLNFSSDD